MKELVDLLWSISDLTHTASELMLENLSPSDKERVAKSLMRISVRTQRMAEDIEEDSLLDIEASLS